MERADGVTSVESLEKMAVLIDADNTQLSKLEPLLQEVSTHGRIVTKRAYGNWRKEGLKNWEAELKRLAIKAEQQFDYTVGKNATDIALVIDAVTLLHRNLYDAFVLVSSDSDYTPLAIHLRESGVYVMGVGKKTTPEAFRNSCDTFIILENVGVEKDDDPPAADEAPEKPAERAADEGTASDVKVIHRLLRIASEQYADDGGFTQLGVAGQYIKRVKPDFDVRSYGFKKLAQFVEAFPKRYKIKKKSTIIYYKCS